MWDKLFISAPDLRALWPGGPAPGGGSDQPAPGPPHAAPGLCGAGGQPGETPRRWKGPSGGRSVSSAPPLLWRGAGCTEHYRGEGTRHTPAFHSLSLRLFQLLSIYFLSFHFSAILQFCVWSSAFPLVWLKTLPIPSAVVSPHSGEWIYKTRSNLKYHCNFIITF